MTEQVTELTEEQKKMVAVKEKYQAIKLDLDGVAEKHGVSILVGIKMEENLGVSFSGKRDQVTELGLAKFLELNFK